MQLQDLLQWVVTTKKSVVSLDYPNNIFFCNMNEQFIRSYVAIYLNIFKSTAQWIKFHDLIALRSAPCTICKTFLECWTHCLCQS